MVVVTLPLEGAGTKDDPFRTNLPTYHEIMTDYTAKTITVKIYEDDLHDDPKKLDAKVHDTSFGPHIKEMSDAEHQKWHEHLDNRYQEHAGKFRPRVA